MKQLTQNQHAVQQMRGPNVAESKVQMEDVLHVLNAIRRGWRLVLLFTLLALTVGLFQVFRIQPVYSATAQVLVNQSGGIMQNMPLGGVDPVTGIQGDFLASHIAIIKSQAVLDDAIKAGKLTNVDFGEIYKDLTVDRIDRVLTIKFTSSDPAKPVKVVEAVIDAYKRFLERTFEKKSTDVVTLISKARDELMIEQDKLEKEHIEFLQRNPHLIFNNGNNNTLQGRLTEWDRGIRSAKAQIFQYDTQIDYARSLLAAGASDATIAKAIRTVGTTIAADPAAALTHAEIGASFDALEQDLADEESFEELTLKYAKVQSARRNSERMLANLQKQIDMGAGQQAAQGDPELTDRRLREAFEDSTEIQKLDERIANLKDQVRTNSQLSKSRNDPTVRRFQDMIKRDEELREELWQEFRRDGEGMFARAKSGVDDLVDDVRTKLIALKAQEATLSEQIDTLSREYQLTMRSRLADLEKSAGVDSKDYKTLKERYDRLMASIQNPNTNADQVRAEAIIQGLQKKVDTLQMIQDRLQGEYDRELAASQKFELDRIAEENLRENKMRTKELLNEILAQLKQAKLVTDPAHVTVSAQVLFPPIPGQKQTSKVLVMVMSLLAGLSQTNK